MAENLRKAQRSGKSVTEVLQKDNSIRNEIPRMVGTAPAPLVRRVSNRASRSGKRSGKVLKVNAESIDEDLERQDTHGTAIRKIAEAMAGFSVERDGIMLDAFRTRMLEYSNFRMLLKRSLSLNFSDSEFEYICSLFDRDGDGTVDGEEFLVVCKLLAHAWRKRGLKKNKERDKYLESVLKEKEDKELAERQAYLENVADFVFAKEDEENMLKVMKKAASKVNKIEPGAPPLHGFEPKYLKPKEAQVAIRNAFRVQLASKELGALIRMFDYEKRGLLDTAAFMVQFSRWGVEYRDAHRTLQLEKSRKAAQDMIERHNNLIQSREKERESAVDMTFADADKESALAKLRVAAKGYRKHSASSVPLDGFSSVTISPGMFREMVKRTFNVTFTGKELGAIVNMFDESGEFEIDCKSFLVFFTRTGIEERFKDHTAQLEESRSKYAALQDHHENKIKALHDMNLISHELLIKVKPEDTESADRKLRFAARHYSMTTCGMPGALDVFNVDKMTPGVFQEKLQKFLNVFLTPVELAALLIQFDTVGDRMYIDCVAFLKFFKRLGFNEKEKLWEEERQRRNNVIEAAIKHKQSVKEKFIAMVENGAVDYNFTKEDSDSALRKMQIGASQYDATNPQAVGLSAFQSAHITPGQLKEKLNRTFNIDLTPKELGSIVQSRLDDEGKVSCESILKLIKELAKSRKEQLRRRRLEAELAEIAEAKERDKRRAEAKIRAEAERLRHEEEDGRTLMKKLNAAAQAFAVDNASFLRVLNALKMPSLSPACFISNFYRIFLYKLSHSEVGLLMKVVNPWAASHHLVDGVSFLKGFYRLSRLQQAVLLGNLNEHELTVDILCPDANLPPRIRANLAATDKKSVSGKWFDVLGDGEDIRSSTASGIRLMPRLAHWTAHQLEIDTVNAQKLRKQHAKSAGYLGSSSSSNGSLRGDDDSVFDMDGGMDDTSVLSAITMAKDSVASHAIGPITPMLSHELDGVNPYEDWGLKEAGFLPAWYHASRPSTTKAGLVTPARSSSSLATTASTSAGRSAMRSLHSADKKEGRVPCLSPVKVELSDEVKGPAKQTQHLNSPKIHSQNSENDSDVLHFPAIVPASMPSPLHAVVGAEVDNPAAHDSVCLETSHDTDLNPQTGKTAGRVSLSPSSTRKSLNSSVFIDEVVDRLSAHTGTSSTERLLTSKPRASSNNNDNDNREQDDNRSVSAKEKVRMGLSRILRPSLPKTFSPVGLARQEVRTQLGLAPEQASLCLSATS